MVNTKVNSAVDTRKQGLIEKTGRGRATLYRETRIRINTYFKSEARSERIFKGSMGVGVGTL